MASPVNWVYFTGTTTLSLFVEFLGDRNEANAVLKHVRFFHDFLVLIAVPDVVADTLGTTAVLNVRYK